MSSEPPGSTPQPPAPPYQPRPAFVTTFLQPSLRALKTGWGQAAIAAVAVLAVVFVLNLLLAWLQQEAASRIFPLLGESAAYPFETPGLVRSALVSLLFWHGVSLDVSVAVPAGDIPFGASVEASVSAALLLGMAIAGYLLFRAGRWVGARSGEAGWLAGAGGLQIALVYAALTLVVGIVSGIDLPLTGLGAEGPSSVSAQPSLLGAFFMPLLLALLASGAGSLHGRISPSGRIARMTLAAISGGWRATWVAVALASIGFLIVAALNPDVTRAYLDLLPGGGVSRFFLIISTLLVVPNMGTGIAAAAMGGSINVTNFISFQGSCALISYTQFPGGMLVSFGAPASRECGIPIELGPAPLQYLLFLLVPLAATFAGGWLASQRSGATDSRNGALAGVTVALPYALGLWALALVARLGYAASTGFFPVELRFWIGPGLFSTVLLAIVWGAAGGALGGAFGARKANGPGTSPGPSVNVSG